MRVISLQSGSNGNGIYVEADGVRLLFDAGISGKRAKERLAAHGREITEVDALVVSHDHSDHVRSMGILQRKFGLPVYATERTFAAASRRCGLGIVHDVRHFAAGETLRFGPVSVETLPTRHDGVEGVAFIVDDGQRRVGVMTDLGHVFDGLEDALRSLDAVLLESNYDPLMLASGPYPPGLKRRIRGPGGHLSNQEAAELLLRTSGERLQWACLGHLSEQNNTPEKAMATHREILRDRLPLRLASRYSVSDVMEVGE